MESWGFLEEEVAFSADMWELYCNWEHCTTLGLIIQRKGTRVRKGGHSCKFSIQLPHFFIQWLLSETFQESLSALQWKPAGAACHFSLLSALPLSVGQHHEELGRLLQHLQWGVGRIISCYVIIPQSSSSLKISSICLSSYSMTSSIFSDGMMDFVSIHLNFKHRLVGKTWRTFVNFTVIIFILSADSPVSSFDVKCLEELESSPLASWHVSEQGEELQGIKPRNFCFVLTAVTLFYYTITVALKQWINQELSIRAQTNKVDVTTDPFTAPCRDPTCVCLLIVCSGKKRHLLSVFRNLIAERTDYIIAYGVCYCQIKSVFQH